MGEYVDKKVKEIRDIFKENLKKVKEGNGYEKIYKAGKLAIKEIVKQIKDDKNIVRGEWALAPLLGSKRTKEKGLINEFEDSYKNVGFWENMFGENEKKISLAVNKIDNAENEVLKRLKRNRTVQDSRQLVKKSGEQHKNNPMFVMEGGSDYKKQTGCLIFTKASNPVRIDQALRGLFDNPDKVYEIDYSGCTNQNIKNRMMGLCGTKTCYLRYDKAQRTYTIRDSEGNGISNRAYIWEGVKLIPAGIRQWHSYVEEKNGKGKLGEETVYNSDKLSKLTLEMFKDMPTMKAAIKKGDMTTKQAVQLCQKTEIRLNNLLKKARELGYELEPECVTKKWFGNGHMELHLNNGSSSVSWTVWGNDGGYNKDLGKDLDEFIDDNEEEYKTYLTKRVQSKWLDFDSVAKTEITDVSKKGGKIGQGKLSEEERKAEKEKAEQHKNQVLIGIGILEQTVNNYDKGGNLLAEMKKLIRNAKVSIGGADVLDDNLITKNFIEPIREKWVIFKNLRDEYGNPVKGYANQHKYFKDIFLGNRDEQVIAMRELGRHGRVLDNTETSHLAEIIAGREDIGIKDAKVGECLDKIKNWTAMSIYDANGNINQKVKGWYDNTYASAKKGTDSLITLFVGRGWLPKNWKDEEKEVRKCMDNLKDKLNSINDQCNNISLSIDDMIKTQHEKRLKLEQKDNKTEEDMKVLQGLVYLEENPNKAKEIYKDVIEKSNMQLKYGDLGQVVKAGLLPVLGELGGGITSNNDKIADIYNDIKGYGFWNLSDENAKLAGEILTEIVITVAVAVVTGGIGGVAMAAILRGGSIALRAAKWTSLANKVLKVVQISQKGYKGLSIGAKVVKSGYRGASLLIEGTTFNAASTMIHSAMNGTSLDALNLNPVAKENVQTAAFLGALSVSGKLTQGLMKLGGKTKLTVNLSKGLEKAHLTAPAKFTTGLVAEMGSMLAAEQAVNFTFGHDVIDPETGEVVTSRAPTLPTQQEMIQMIGMILAFKTVKPGIWAKYEQKLNNGTLEICRGTGKNQVLIRDPQTGKVENVQDLIDGKESTKGNQGKSDGKAKGQIEKGKKSTSSEKVQKAEEELNGIRDKITGVEARIKRIDGQIKNFEASREISNRERLAKDISKRRTYSENGNKPSDNIPINDHYEGRIIDEKIEIIDKRTGKINTVEFDAKKRINDLLGNDKELEKLDIEIAERMILGIKNGHAEVTGIEEAIKIKNGYPDMNLEIVGLENGNYGVRKKSNIRKLRQQKAELDAQLKGLKSEHRKKRTALNKEKKSQDKDNIEQKVKEDKEKQTSVEQNGDGEVRGQEQRQERGRNEGNDKIDKPEDVERDLEQLVSRMKTGSYESIKLDWVSQKMFETGVFIEGVHRRFKNLSLKPNMKLPKEFLERMRDKLVDMKNRWGEMLSEYHRKLVDKYNQYIEKKLAEKGDDVEIREEEINLVEKESGINEQNEKVEQKSLTEKERFAESMGSDLHEVWRKDYAAKPENIDADGRVKPRIRPTTDKEWIETHGGINDVDIYYTPFKELPLDRKKNNLDAAKVVIDLVYDKIVAGEEITPEMIEEMSATVHEEWLKRNGWAKGGKLDKPYYELPEVEKVKDRNQVLQAIEKIGGKQKRTEIERQFAEKGEIKESDKPEVIAEKLEESLDNSTDFEVSQEAFVSGKFIEGIKNRFNKIIQRPNVSLPRESVKRLSGKIKEMMNKWGSKLSDNYRNLTERFSRYLNDLLKQTGEKIKIKEQQRIERKEEKRRQREEQQRRQGRQTEEGDDIIEAVEITGYQENIETTDGGRFTGEIKNGELYKGKFTDKNGNEWYIDKSSDYPVMRYQDKILLDRIGNKESINVGELKRTHRTNFNGLNKIIDSGIIGNNSNRGVQFWGGLGACYGEVAIIMKNSVMNLPPAPANIQKGHGNYDYFFSGHGAKDRNWQTFQKEASNFSYCRQEDPNIDVPYLSIGGKNGLKGDFAHEVGIEHVEAVILPTHVKNYPGYQELIKKLNDKGIKVIEAPTEENILDYAGGSVILAKDGKRGSFDKAIIEELAKRYPNIPTFEQQAITYLRETGRIKENDIRGKSFTEIREDYIKIANKNGFTRGSTRGGQYQNYSSQKNYTKEQQAYFKYIVKSRIAKEYDKYPNPKIKAIEENLDYPTGTEVYVKLEKGGETKAKVESYDTTTKEYTVRWEEGGQTLQKRVTTESLRKPGTSISILGISDPQTFINVAAELIKKGKSKTLIQDLKQELLKDSNKSELDHYKKTFLELQLRGENVDEIADYFRLRQSFNIGDFERNKEGVQKYYEEKIKPEMIETDNIKKKIMTEISSKTNGEPKDPPLKGAERASDRVIQLDYNFNSLLDVSRGTILYDNLDGVYNALNLILNHPEVKDVFLRDNFKIRSTGYRDINLAIKTRTGNCFELQLNTKKLFQAKEEGLTISKEFINSKLDKGETSNYFGIVEELYNGNKIFNETDIKIHEIINNKLKKDIPIPDINEPLTGHNLYELIRELNNISEGKAKQERELPNRLPTDSNISYQDLINYKNKITGFNNLLYDYASPT